MERKDERKEGMRRSQKKKKIAERECLKSVGSTEAALFNLNLK